jgi:tRNA modification GTPase
LHGVPVLLTDTAGIRKAGDRIEEIGVERTHRAMADADLIVVILDGSRDLAPQDQAVLEQADQGKHVVAVNKCDLPAARSDDRLSQRKLVHVSALTGEGLDQLTAAILEPFGRVDSEAAGLLITNSRHHDLLQRAQRSLEESMALLDQGASEELVLVGLYNALKFLGEITGETTAEDILTEIFSTFCIGK